MKVPELDDDPELLPPDLLVVWQSYGVLSGTRGRGFGAQPITLVEIEAYCRLHNVDDREDFVYFILALDAHWMDWVSKQGGS
ncbi:MAG: hypothetical protein V3S69_02980 [Dehalococcoidales bacterium]